MHIVIPRLTAKKKKTGIGKNLIKELKWIFKNSQLSKEIRKRGAEKQTKGKTARRYT